MKKLCILGLLISHYVAYSQKPGIGLAEGSLELLNGQRSVNIEFCYEGIKVGKFEREQDYVSNKKDGYNRKNPGKGDQWEIAWYANRKKSYEPIFKESFAKESGFQVSEDSPLTFIFNTTFMEPGFNVGVQRKNAEVSGDAYLVESNNKSNVLAKIHIERAHSTGAAVVWGADYNESDRMMHTYRGVGWALGRFILDKRTGILSNHRLDKSRIVSTTSEAAFNACISQLSNSSPPNESVPTYTVATQFSSSDANASIINIKPHEEDFIITKDGTEIQAKILEVGLNDIKFKKLTYLSGPTYTLPKSDLKCVEYKNGEREFFGKFTNR